MLFKLKVAVQEICTLAWTWSPSPRSFLLALDKSGSRKSRQWWHLYAIFSLHVKWTIPGYSEASPWNWSWTFGNMWHLIMLLKLEVAVQEICTLFESSDCWCPQGPTNLWGVPPKFWWLVFPCRFSLDLIFWKTSWSSLIPSSNQPTILRHIREKSYFAHLLMSI